MRVVHLTSRKFALNASIAVMLGGAAIRSLGRSVQMSSLNSGALYIGLHLVIFGLLIYGFHRRNFEATVLLTVIVSFAIFGAPYAFVAWLEGDTSWVGMALVAVYSALALLATPALIATTWRIWRARKDEATT